MPYQCGETWRFQVRDSDAERVYLVRYSAEGLSLWTAMERAEPSVWESHVHLGPGHYRFAYFTSEGNAFFNGGTFGLSGQRVSEPDPQVTVSPLPRVRLDEAGAVDGEAREMCEPEPPLADSRRSGG